MLCPHNCPKLPSIRTHKINLKSELSMSIPSALTHNAGLVPMYKNILILQCIFFTFSMHQSIQGQRQFRLLQLRLLK